ncbi:hypothetical protein MalM25_32990 [Planctomycetes bacterium MalM25]|nr:hypothetical protein MalM25_32990 [Planctomycetes bacterium MalM25]
MNGSPWTLPGPSRFLMGILAAIESGECVVLQAPPHTPPGIAEALQRMSRDSDARYWHRVRSSEFDAEDLYAIVDLLARRLLPEAARESSCDIGSFVESLGDKVVWIEIDCVNRWSHWLELIEGLRTELHRLHEADRPAFCFHAGPSLSVPSEEIGVSIHRFRGVLSRTDVTTAVREHRRAARPSAATCLAEETAVAVAAILAGADYRLAEHLAALDLRDLLEPLAALNAYAAGQPWLGGTDEPDWARGTLDTIGGESVVHSAHPSIAGRPQHIGRLVWEGQLGVLFPYLEKRRLALLEIVGPQLRLPVETPAGVVTDPLDLELGPLVYHLKGRGVPRGVWNELVTLRNVRHLLAHVEVVPVDTVLDLQRAPDWDDGVPAIRGSL